MRHKLALGEDIHASAYTDAQKQTFQQFAADWFEHYVVPNNKYSEQQTKRHILSASLVPCFGRLPVGKITTQHVEQYKAGQIKTGVSNKTINNRLTVLNKCLLTAFDWLRLEGTPPKIKKLKCVPPRTDFLSEDECERLLSSSEGVIREMIHLALRTGLRQGELRGLQWDSIDWENRVLIVRHSLCNYTNELTTPKSNRDRRIPLSDDTYEMLRARRKDTGYVFTSELGRPFHSRHHLRCLKRAQIKAGLRSIGWHTLRHTFASHLAMRGAPLHVVQQLLGHSTIEMTLRYAHVSASNVRAAIDLLANGNRQSIGSGSLRIAA